MQRQGRIPPHFRGVYSLDRRLIGADVWLVERLPNGKEESQLQSVRGSRIGRSRSTSTASPMGRSASTFSASWSLTSRRAASRSTVEAVRARPDTGQKGYQSARWFRSTIHVKPGETVEVALTPRDKDSPELANRVFSLRIRAKQIR